MDPLMIKALNKVKRSFPGHSFERVIYFRNKYIFHGVSKKYGDLGPPIMVIIDKDTEKLSSETLMELTITYGDEFSEAFKNAVTINNRS